MQRRQSYKKKKSNKGLQRSKQRKRLRSFGSNLNKKQESSKNKIVSRKRRKLQDLKNSFLSSMEIMKSKMLSLVSQMKNLSLRGNTSSLQMNWLGLDKQILTQKTQQR